MASWLLTPAGSLPLSDVENALLAVSTILLLLLFWMLDLHLFVLHFIL